MKFVAMKMSNLPIFLGIRHVLGNTGNDGTPAEFYKTFCNSVGVFVTEVINHSFELGQMSNSQKQAVSTLIDKKGRDRMVLENWRPISLINVDSKIVTEVIANGMKNIFFVKFITKEGLLEKQLTQS